MSKREVSASQLSLTEETIIRVFGWAVIEFEATLFQKFLHMSVDSSLITEDAFRKHLLQMEAKGWLASMDFQGKRVWKKLVVEDDLELTLRTPEEIRESIKKKSKALREKRRTKVKEHLVTDSKTIGEDILSELEGCLLRGKQPSDKDRQLIFSHIENMRRALCESEETFLEYVQTNVPGIAETIEQVLRARGHDFLILSLRILETR